MGLEFGDPHAELPVGMIKQFLDLGDVSFHDRFQAWHTRHQDGVFLTLDTKTRANLHGARCQHLGSGPPYFLLKHGLGSLTTKQKVCAPQEELLAWAAENGVAVEPCQHCLRDGLISSLRSRLVSIPLPVRPADTAAAEGLTREVRAFARGRNARLRDAALKHARGICAACSTDFSQLLGGNGVHVLQVHHRKQLALSNVPRVTHLDDLAVLCANCHALIHIDRKRALSVEKLRAVLRLEWDG